MKYTYRKIYEYIPVSPYPMKQALSAINNAMQGNSFDLKNLNSEVTEIFMGGTFYPESEDINETDLMLTDYDVVYRNRDYNRAFVNDFMKYLGHVDLPDAEYIGKWTDDIDNNAHIYYIIDGNTVRKFIMVRHGEMTFTNINGASDIQFIVNIDGKMSDCFLDDGDLLFTDYDEAFNYVIEMQNKQKKEETKDDKD
ncbi:MAG: hypothetical protein [Wendovervirus sonii]|uniref:Uncharacterized protein n=1 Tax=phage Lak_Megaphage_Sonny TaxID=3109229 RepID=A0ABZ0Z382_9CAUD|nr:MAG: hypothetical protein [phage Lak_Megaphage_Sonny]